MSTATQGTNWSVTADNVFTIFGKEGFVAGRKWDVPSIMGARIKINPAPASRDIAELVQADIADGNGEKIAYVGISPFGALRLALEGVLTKEILCGAEETPETITVTLPLGGTNRKVVILKDPKYTFATFGKDGKMI